MRTTGVIAAAALCVLAACGEGDSTENRTQLSDAATSAGSPVSGGRQALESARETAGAQLDKAKLAAFVASFRTGYAELAEDRNDESIEHIVIESCIDIANGVDEHTVTTIITALAENHSTTPTAEQAGQIYRLVVRACP
jgi:hypothetical protein